MCVHTDCSARNWYTEHAANAGHQLDAAANYIRELIFFSRLRSPFLYCIWFGVRSGAKCSPTILITTTNNDDTNLMRCLSALLVAIMCGKLSDIVECLMTMLIPTFPPCNEQQRTHHKMGFSDERHTVAGRRKRKRHFSLSLSIYPTTWGIMFCHVMSVVSMLLSLKPKEMVLLSLFHCAKWENIVELGAAPRMNVLSVVLLLRRIWVVAWIFWGNLAIMNRCEVF